jgi:adenylate kinase
MNLIFLGPPGSGKGTQASRLEQLLKVKKISTGELLRKAVQDGTELGKQAQSLMDAGQLVSDDIMILLIKNQISSDICATGFILDGFPRTIAQAEALDDVLRSSGKRIDCVLELEVDDNVIVERISNRYNCAVCGTSYNNKFHPPKQESVCDYCGSTEFVVREDDKAEKIIVRLKAYHEQTAKLLSYYTKHNLLYRINGMADIKDVSNQIDLILHSFAKSY